MLRVATTTRGLQTKRTKKTADDSRRAHSCGWVVWPWTPSSAGTNCENRSFVGPETPHQDSRSARPQGTPSMPCSLPCLDFQTQAAARRSSPDSRTQSRTVAAWRSGARLGGDAARMNPLLLSGGGRSRGPFLGRVLLVSPPLQPTPWRPSLVAGLGRPHSYRTSQSELLPPAQLWH